MAFTNINTCRSFNLSLSVGLSALASQDCTEVIVFNQSTVPVLFYDNGYNTDANSFVLAPSATFTFRGINNSSALSAKTTSGSGVIYYRTQYYAMHVLNRS